MIHRFFAALLLALPVMLLAPGAAQAEEFTEGKDYQLIVPAQPGGSNGKVQVVEMFWYGCPHCFHFEPTLKKWLENKPANVEFIRVPAIFTKPAWKLHAKAYYTAEVLEVMDKFHKPFFDAIHRENKRMSSEESIREFFVGLGVDGEEFDQTFNSFAVQSKMRRAADLTKKYGIKGVPAMVIDGKYHTGGSMAGSNQRMMAITDALVAREAGE